MPSREAQQNEAIYTIEAKQETATKPAARSPLDSLRAGMRQMRPMFHKPLLGLALNCYTIQFSMFLGLNTIRLWLPQLFSSMADYETEYGDEQAAACMCTILEYSVNKTAETLTNHENACAVVREINSSMFAISL